MSGYKIEIWNYDVYSCEEAQQHIIKMAAEGYELVSLSKWLFPFACYKKAGKPSDKHYEVTVMPPEKDESFGELCRDSGWEPVAEGEGLGVFCAVKENAAPIFTDESSFLQMKLDYMNKQVGCMIPICIAFVCGGAYMIYGLLDNALSLSGGSIAEILPFMWIFAVCMIFMVMESISGILERKYIRLRAEEAEAGGFSEKPLKLKKFKKICNIAGFIMVVFWILLVTYGLVARCGLTGIIFAIGIPIVYFAGFYMTATKKMSKLGSALMYICFMLYIIAPQFIRVAGDLILY